MKGKIFEKNEKSFNKKSTKKGSKVYEATTDIFLIHIQKNNNKIYIFCANKKLNINKRV